MNIKAFLYGLTALVAAAGFSSCQDDIDAPKISADGPKATWEANTTILELKNAFWKDNDYNYCEQFPARADGSHYIIKGWVISDDKGGNIYKTIYIRDETAALSISVNEYNLWLLNRVGQEVVIDVTGMYGGRYSGQMQLGAPKWNTSLNKYTGAFMAPEFYQNHRQLNGLPDESKAQPIEGPSFGELNANARDSEYLKKWQGQLVRFNNVAFPAADGKETLCSNYQTSISAEQNRVLEDANGDAIVVRTSGYADFWNTKLPEGRGDIVGILGYYLASPTASITTSAWQLMILTEDDLMNFGNPTLPKGEMTNPYTVEEAVAMETAGETPIGWVEGFIVGTVKPQVESVTSAADIEWGATATLDNTVVIGATADTQDLNECLVISLPQGSVMRQYVALANHPENLGKRLNVRGTLDKYMGTFGVTGNTGTAPEFRLEGVDVPGADDPTPGPTQGDGTAENPYSPSQIIMTSKPSGATPNVYVKGYIVGFIPDKSISEAQFALPATTKTNMLIADTPDGNTSATVLPIALPSGAIREALNLQDHPENFGKLVTLCGSYEAYFGVAGIKSVSWYQFDGEGGDTPVTPPATGGSEILNATFTGSQDGFTIENGTLPEGLTQVWTLDSYGYMKASAYNKASYAVDAAYLVSPVLDLTGKTSASMSFRQAIGQFRDSSGALTKPQNMVFYVIREEGGAWGAPVAINDFPDYPAGKNFTSFDNGPAIDLTPYAGKKVQVGFKYTSTTSMAGTWEIDNVVVTAQ
ncbi:MAG: DUF6359 domain-containing protein [[Clostridium] fimetarium]|nr:DUF6359 domain-containing protein [Alistipes timonensis]MCM1405636.1 DUF6359 domain-containing protein [[Clostridium] fimetarium]